MRQQVLEAEQARKATKEADRLADEADMERAKREMEILAKRWVPMKCL